MHNVFRKKNAVLYSDVGTVKNAAMQLTEFVTFTRLLLGSMGDGPGRRKASTAGA